MYAIIKIRYTIFEKEGIKAMRNSRKNSGLSPLALILIITTSIVAAVGIVLLVLNICKKRRAKKLDPWYDDSDSWELDDDLLGELRFDDEDECCCGCDCGEEVSDDIANAVDEAIEAIESVTDEMEKGE